MNIKLRILILFICCCIFSACNFRFIKDGVLRIPTVNNNVCKKLKGNVVLYAIFVDTKDTHPWSEYDIRSTLDSIQKASKWIEDKSHQNGVLLDIDVQYHQNKNKIPLVANLANKTLSATLFSPVLTTGIKKLDRWSNGLAKEAGKSFFQDTISMVATKNKISDRERLVAKLRDINKTDQIVLMYFVNNYYKSEISMALHTASNTNIEYAIVSFKNPAVIAHEFLHLFGALDLYISPFDKGKKIRKRKEVAMKEFPYEIMAFTYKNIDSLDVSPFTKYLIGWQNELDEKSTRMLLGKNIKVLKY